MQMEQKNLGKKLVGSIVQCLFRHERERGMQHRNIQIQLAYSVENCQNQATKLMKQKNIMQITTC